MIRTPFEFPFQDSVIQTQVIGYDIHEMLGTKLRALFQRRRGRGLFDIYWTLTLAKPALVPAQIIESFQHYLKLEGSRVDFVCCDMPNADPLSIGIIALMLQSPYPALTFIST